MTESTLHPIAELAEARVSDGPLDGKDAKALFEALSKTPPDEVAFAVTTLLAVATKHPSQAHKLIRLASTGQNVMRSRLRRSREAREDEGRTKLRRFHTFLAG